MKHRVAHQRSWVRAGVIIAVVALGPLAIADNAPMTVSWKGMGPGGGGAIRSIAVSSRNTGGDERVIATSDVGGVFLSQDWGATWTTSNDKLADPTGGAFVYSQVAGV